MELSLEPIPLAQVVKDVVQLCQPLADRAKITLIAPEIDPDLHVIADQKRLVQVFINIINNAIKYNRPRGSVRLTVERQITADGEQLVVVACQDTGLGLSEEQIAKLFRPFERLGADQRGIEGTGIGLALSKQLLLLMSGQLLVESTVGEGSTFSVVLQQTYHAKLGLMANITDGVFMNNAGRSVLYIEDNLSNLELVKAILKRLNVQLLFTMKGREGLALLEQHPVDLVLLDLHLPDMLGSEVLVEIRQHPGLQHLPVIMLTADAMKSRENELLALGATAYISKPFDVRQFLETVSGLLDSA
jgi:CheY-like chemotaxis protein